MMADQRVLQNRSGFTLVEIVMAMMILSIILVSLAGLSFRTARQAMDNVGLDQRQATLMQEVNRLASVPHTSLSSQVGCRSVTTGTFPYERCVSTSTVTANVTRVTIVVTPARAQWAPDTVFVDRSSPPASPLNSN